MRNRTKLGNQVVHHPTSADVSPVHIRFPPRKVSLHGAYSPMFLFYSYILLTTIGGLLLLLPISSTQDGWTPVRDAFFTAASASTITGLIVTDTATAWTAFGKAVILILIFLGGIGFITGTAFIFLIMGQRLGLAQKIILRQGSGEHRIGFISVHVRRIVAIAIITQLLGTVLFFITFWLIEPIWEGITWYQGIWYALFHSVSAFNNAGFEIFPDTMVKGTSLEWANTKYITMGIFIILILLGGFGQSIITELYQKRKWNKFTLDFKIVVTGTTALILIGSLFFGINNWNNPATLGGATIGSKIVSTIFESITPRSAGFSTIQHVYTTDIQIIGTMVLMFIGGPTGSTAGGIKVNTFMVIVAAIIAILKGSRHTSIFSRELPLFTIQIAFTIASISVAIIIISVITLAYIQPEISFRLALFEVVSAFGTVGLSIGATEKLNIYSSILIIILMLVGRLGPITLALLISGRDTTKSYRFASEGVKIG